MLGSFGGVMPLTWGQNVNFLGGIFRLVLRSPPPPPTKATFCTFWAISWALGVLLGGTVPFNVRMNLGRMMVYMHSVL